MARVEHNENQVLGAIERYLTGESMSKVAKKLGYSTALVRQWVFWVAGRDLPGYKGTVPKYVMVARNTLGEEGGARVGAAIDSRSKVRGIRRRASSEVDLAMDFAVRYEAAEEKRGACPKIAEKIGISTSLAYAYRDYIFSDKEPTLFKGRRIPEYLQQVKRRFYREQGKKEPVKPQQESQGDPQIDKIAALVAKGLDVEVRPDGSLIVRRGEK